MAVASALSRSIDPEEQHDIIAQAQATCGAILQQFEGHIAQHVGYGILVYFGHPRAHEDDAQRAVRAGLAIIQALDQMPQREQRQSEAKLTVRVGIHTGVVVVSNVGREDKLDGGLGSTIGFM